MVGFLRNSVGTVFLLAGTSSIFIEYLRKLHSETVISHTGGGSTLDSGWQFCLPQRWLP